jgi:4-hydroxybenzoate polyprenyltransferase
LIYFFGKKQKSILYAIGVTVILYILLFIQGAFVGIIMSLVTSKTLSSGADAFLMMYNNLGQSFFKTHHGWVLSQIWTHQKIEESFALFMARLHIISSIVLLGILIRKYTKNIFQWLVEHVAWVKIFCYVALSCVGMYIAQNLFLSEIFATYINITGLLMLILSFCFHGITATIVNDIADQELDNDTHPDRVLQTGKISLKDYKTIGLVSFCLAIITSVTINYTVTLYLVILQGLYFLHATPPFRLKQNWMSSILIYFFMGFTVLLIGYFFISSTQKISEIPVVLFFLISSIVGISSIAKDIGDHEGDKKHGINSFPVQFGQIPALVFVLLFTVIGIVLLLLYLKLYLVVKILIPFVIFHLFFMIKNKLTHQSIKTWSQYAFVIMFKFIILSLFVLSF